MDAGVDSRFLERWTESCRRQSEARRFLARQEIPSRDLEPEAIGEVIEAFRTHGAPGRDAAGGVVRPISSIGDLVD